MRLTEQRRNELLSRGGTLYRTALQESRKLTDAEQAELRTVEAEIDRDDYEAQHGTPTPTEAQRRFTQQTVETRASVERPAVLTTEMRMSEYVRGTYPAEHEGLSLGKFVRGFVTGQWENADLERRAMAEGSVGSGGAMVPTPLSARVIDLIRNQSVVMRAGATTVPMSAPTLKLARLTTDPTAAWTAENATITSSDGVFEAVDFTARKLAALVKISTELIEDSNADAVIENALAQVLALELDRVALFGTGTAPQPKGIHAYATSIIAETSMGTNGAQLTSFDPFSDAYFAIMGNNITPKVVIYSPRTAKSVDLLKSSVDLTPLPPPESFKNLTKLVSNQISNALTQGSSSVASSAFVGDFAGLGIGMRTQLVIEASREAGTAFQDGQVWIRAYLRGDVQLLRPTAFNVIRGILA